MLLSEFPRFTSAAILIEQNKDLLVAEIKLPDSLDVGQVLVKFHYSGICGSQIGEIDGIKGADKWLPHLLGHEGSGEVLAVGPGVSNVSPNDYVVAHWRKGLGIDAKPPKYFLDKTLINAGSITTFNQYAVISENRLTSISRDCDLCVAAMYGCAITTGLGTIENKARVKIGDVVVVYGAGGIGLNLIQGANIAGASQIIAVDLFENKLELASKLGATKVINASYDPNPFATLATLATDSPVDVFIDNTGIPDIISRGYSLVSRSGKVVLVGVPKAHTYSHIPTFDLHFGKSITGTDGGECIPHVDIRRYMNFFKAKEIDMTKTIGQIGGLNEINQLISNMRLGNVAGRTIISMGI